MTVPDAAFRRYVPAIDEEDGDGIKPTTLDLQAVTFVDSGGNGHLDPGETALTDLTPGRTLRSVLAEAFADQFTTGSLEHYPRHLPCSSNPELLRKHVGLGRTVARRSAGQIAFPRHGRQHGPAPVRIHPGRDRHVRGCAARQYLWRASRQSSRQEHQVSDAVTIARRCLDVTCGGSRAARPGIHGCSRPGCSAR